MLSLDHLTVIAPTLAEGLAHVRSCLGLDIADGARHPDMGTHNCRLRLGDDLYLEVIAVDPEAAPPGVPRWFGLSDARAVRTHWEEGWRLRAWVARTGDMEALLKDHGDLFGGNLPLGSAASFALRSDGALPGEGILPLVIDRAGLPPPSVRMRDLGARLVDFALEHPSPDRVRAQYDALGIQNPPHVRHGLTTRYVARIETPDGVKILT